MKKKDKKSKKSGGKTVDFSKHLRGLNRHLEQAKEKSKEKGFEEFDDGRYKMRAVDAKIGVSKNKRVQVVITWKFMDGDNKGKEKLDFEGLQEDHLPYLLKKLDAMGYDTSEIEDLEKELQEMLDDIKKTKPKCKCRLKTKGEFQNLYVDGLLGDDEEEEEDEDADEDDSKKSKKKSKKKDDDEDEEDEDEDEDEDASDDDEDEEDEDEDEDEDASDDDEDEEDDEEEDDEEEKPKKKSKKGKKADDDDEEEDDEEDEDEADDEEEEVDDEIEVVVGSVVKANTKKYGKVKGEVVEVMEADGKILLKTEKGKTVKIKAEQILSVEESPAASVPKKKKKSKK